MEIFVKSCEESKHTFRKSNIHKRNNPENPGLKKPDFLDCLSLAY